MNDVHEDTESNEAPNLAKLLLRLQLPFLRENYHELAQTAAEQHWSHLDYLQRLVEGEVNRREDSGLARRIRLARFPVLKTLDQFDWSWPKKINRPQLQNLFRLQFIKQKSNAILLCRPRQDPHVDRSRPHCLPTRLQRALHHRHRHHPHALRRHRCRQSTARHAAILKARTFADRRSRISPRR